MTDLVTNLAKSLNISKEAAQSLVNQEVARKAASEKYRKSDAYRLRLEQQKAVRAALKSVEVS